MTSHYKLQIAKLKREQYGPSTERMRRLLEAHVLAAERVQGDDTTVPVMAKDKTATGRLWDYVRDDRPSHQCKTSAERLAVRPRH